MIINDFYTEFAAPSFAYNMGACNNYSKFLKLGDFIETISPSPYHYKDGDEIHENIREYVNFPEYIGVLYDLNGKFMLQTFIGNKVHKLFDDVLANESEIYKFFMDAKEDIGIYECFEGRQLPLFFDSFILYVNKLNEYRKNLDIHLLDVYKYIDKLRKANKITEIFPDSNAGIHYDMCVDAITSSIDSLNNAIHRTNIDANAFLETFYTDTPKDIANAILFGIYYRIFSYYNDGILGTYGTVFNLQTALQELADEFFTFVQNNPTVLSDYCEYMELSDEKAKSIEEFMNYKNISRILNKSTADEIL